MHPSLIALIVIMAPMVMCYDEKYDKIDVDKILADEKLFTAYVNCLLDRGPCEVQYSGEFRNLLPEVIATSCAKCTPIQKQGVRKMVKAIQERSPEAFIALREKYDPQSKYEKDFLEFVLATD